MKHTAALGAFLVLTGAHASAQTASSEPRKIIDRYCVTCHNQKLKTAGLMLDKVDPANVGPDAQVWEKVVRKLRAGIMPPAGMPRPDAATYEALTVSLENDLDRAAAAHPKLAAPGAHRLNRTEYANAIHDLLGIDIDAAQYLPADDSSYGFDNVVSGLQVSPTLVEGYVTAASKISRLALGHDTAPTRKVYHAREDYSQEDHIDGPAVRYARRLTGAPLLSGRRRISHLVGAGPHDGGRSVWRRQRR